jgi:hypothetical protein
LIAWLKKETGPGNSKEGSGIKTRGLFEGLNEIIAEMLKQSKYKKSESARIVGYI